MTQIAIIGSGPAGLMVAEVLADAGLGVTVYDAMPSFGRKFLMAGKSGLNITHSEADAVFATRFPDADPRLLAALEAFGPLQVRDWMAGLGIVEHVGSSGRVFPSMMKASPLLRAWLKRLQASGVAFKTRWRWLGWDDNRALIFTTPDGRQSVSPEATVLALGGGSWRRLGSDGAWRDTLSAIGVETVPFAPSNGGFVVPWSTHMRENWAGTPVKAVMLSVGGQRVRGEFVVAERGVEGGAIYTLSAHIRETLAEFGTARLKLDLVPDIRLSELNARLNRPQGRQTLSNFLRKSIRLSGVKTALVYECLPRSVLTGEAEALALALKAVPLNLTGAFPLDEAISTAGGVCWSALNAEFGLKPRPDVFCAGEMLDWDAPTGGYLITACLATGRAAAKGVLARLQAA